MLSVPFYHSLLKKYVIIFGTLFNNIRIERVETDGTIAQRFKVPIAYGPREKFLARVEDNPDASMPSAIRLPRMSFEMVGINYASSRKLQTTRSISTINDINGNSVYRKAYTPVPYDIDFELNIIAKNTEDATRIVEQILPYFTPEWTISARLLEGFDQLTDIPLVLQSVNINDNYDNDFLIRRTLVYTLRFTLKGYLYGPVSQSKIIKISEVNLTAPMDAITTLSRTTTQPGLTDQGEPTTSIDETIPYTQIDETDTYGYIVTVETLPND